MYRRSGNFHVKKLSYNKFLCKKFSYERPLTTLALIMHANFRSYPMQFSMLHKVVLVVSLLLAFTPRSAVFCVCGCLHLPGVVDYDPMQFQRCINLH